MVPFWSSSDFGNCFKVTKNIIQLFSNDLISLSKIDPLNDAVTQFFLSVQSKDRTLDLMYMYYIFINYHFKCIQTSHSMEITIHKIPISQQSSESHNDIWKSYNCIYSPCVCRLWCCFTSWVTMPTEDSALSAFQTLAAFCLNTIWPILRLTVVPDMYSEIAVKETQALNEKCVENI